MSTAPATITHQKSAKEAHTENVEFAVQNNLPLVKIVGNTFPVKGLLFALGGNWNPQENAWMVPQHNAATAQIAANKFTKGTAEYAAANPPKAPKAQAAPKAAKPVQTSTAAPAKVAPTVHNTAANLKTRLEMLAKGAAALGKDLEAALPTEGAMLSVIGAKLAEMAAKA